MLYSSDPPLVVLSMRKRPNGREKDSRHNIRERSRFVIHIPHREQAEVVTAGSAVLGHGESELERLRFESLSKASRCRV